MDDSLLLRFYISREKQRIADNEKTFNLTMKRPFPSWEVVELRRFRRLYNSGRFHIRLMLHKFRSNGEPVLIIMHPEDAIRSISQIAVNKSIDIKELEHRGDDLVNSSNIVQELLNSLDTLDCSNNRYVFLRCEGFSAFWEVLGCQSPLKDEPCSRNSSRPSTPHSVIDLSVTDNVHVIEPVSPVNNQSFINLHTQPTPASSHLVS